MAPGEHSLGLCDLCPPWSWRMFLCFPSCHSPRLESRAGVQGLNPCHSRERSWAGEGHTKAQLASCSPVSYKLFSSPSASEQTVQNCGSRMPQIPPGSPCPGCPAQGSLCSALVPGTAWGTLAHPGDSSGEGLPQSHLGCLKPGGILGDAGRNS